MAATEGKYEYKVISGSSRKLAALDSQLNELTNDGWEILQSSACPAGGFGFGLGSGGGGGSCR